MADNKMACNLQKESGAHFPIGKLFLLPSHHLHIKLMKGIYCGKHGINIVPHTVINLYLDLGENCCILPDIKMNRYFLLNKKTTSFFGKMGGIQRKRRRKKKQQQNQLSL